METGLRRAWVEVVTPEDYEAHMAAVGQAQAAAKLTRELLGRAALPEGSRLTIVGAGTGQMLELLGPEPFRPFRLMFTDLSPAFLRVLEQRLTKLRLEASVLVDDLEQTRLLPEPEFLLASLVLEQLDWREGVRALVGLRPRFCGVVLQENPPGMTSAVTPGRELPPSLTEAMAFAHPKLVPQDELIAAMDEGGFRCTFRDAVEVADRKQIIGLLFQGPRSRASPTSTRA